MNFKEWLQLQEVGTGTNAIAGFTRMLGDGGDLIRRGETCDRDKRGKCHLPLVMMRFNSPKIGNALEHKR